MHTMTKNFEALEQEYSQYKDKMTKQVEELSAQIKDLHAENEEQGRNDEPHPFEMDNLSEEMEKGDSPNLSVIEM